MALAWLLARPAVTSLVIGARTDEQLADNLARGRPAADGRGARPAGPVSAPPLLYPYWHQAKLATDRLSPADEALLGQFIGR